MYTHSCAAFDLSYAYDFPGKKLPASLVMQPFWYGDVALLPSGRAELTPSSMRT